MYVSEVKDCGLYDEAFTECLPEICFDDRCGCPTEISENLTGLHCSNPKCPTKIAQRIDAIVKQLGIKDLGVAKANGFIDKFGINNPLAIFAYESSSDGTLTENTNIEVSERIEKQIQAHKKFTLAEYVRVANIPHIQSSAIAIFGEYDDLSEAYTAIESGGVNYIREKLCISKGSSDGEDGDVSIRATNVYNSLMTFKDDLFSCLPYVEIIETHKKGMISIKAVCSDEVGYPYPTKSAFYADVNSRFGNIHVDFLNSVSKKIDYLIWAGADGSEARHTNKVEKVMGYNENFEIAKNNNAVKNGEHYIPIVTAAQFIEILTEMGKRNEELIE